MRLRRDFPHQGVLVREHGRDLADYGSPIAARLLAEEPRRRIPRAVLALEEPAPIGNERQHDPNPLAHGAGEMGDRRVDGNDEVEIGDGAGGLREVCELGRKIGDARRSFTHRRADLEAEDAHALERKKGARSAKARERFLSKICLGLPAQAKPTLSPSPSPITAPRREIAWGAASI